MTKALIFDADGMVINTSMFSVKFCEEYDLSYDVVEPFFKNEFQACLVGKADLKTVIKPYLKRWRWPQSVDSFLDYWFKAEHSIDQRVVSTISSLRNKEIKCYLATNQEMYRTHYLKDQMGLKRIFDKIFSSAEVGHKKPQQEFFAAVIEQIGYEKPEIQFWDDTGKNVAAAVEFGLDGKIYTTFEQFQAEIAPLLK